MKRELRLVILGVGLSLASLSAFAKEIPKKSPAAASGVCYVDSYCSQDEAHVAATLSDCRKALTRAGYDSGAWENGRHCTQVLGSLKPVTRKNRSEEDADNELVCERGPWPCRVRRKSDPPDFWDGTRHFETTLDPSYDPVPLPYLPSPGLRLNFNASCRRPPSWMEGKVAEAGLRTTRPAWTSSTRFSLFYG